MVLGELSKTVGGCHSSMAKQQVFKLRGRGGVNGYGPPLIRTAVRGAVGRPTQMGAPWR
jgi:hypothetical protein